MGTNVTYGGVAHSLFDGSYKRNVKQMYHIGRWIIRPSRHPSSAPCVSLKPLFGTNATNKYANNLSVA